MMYGGGKSDPVPAPVTHFPGTEPGACFADPHFPWSPSLAPLTPRRIAPRCSTASQLLFRIRQISPSSTRGRSRMHKGARPDLCGGRGATRVPTATEQNIDGTFKQTGWRFRQGNFCHCVIGAADDVTGRNEDTSRVRSCVARQQHAC